MSGLQMMEDLLTDACTRAQPMQNLDIQERKLHDKVLSNDLPTLSFARLTVAQASHSDRACSLTLL